MPREYTLHTHTDHAPRIDFRSELNPQQYEAVVSPPGQALVIAGAGSGKTRTLIYRVAYLLDNGVQPEQILLLTFTNKAAREMLERVQNLLSIETGRLAKQADGSVVVRYGDTMILVTAVSAKEKKDVDFLPLTVEYKENLYAAGRIPGSYFKREGRLTERETLVSRLIDRSCRPLFPEGYAYETQVISSVISSDQQNDSDVLGLTGASAALWVSNICT